MLLRSQASAVQPGGGPDQLAPDDRSVYQEPGAVQGQRQPGIPIPGPGVGPDRARLLRVAGSPGKPEIPSRVCVGERVYRRPIR